MALRALQGLLNTFAFEKLTVSNSSKPLTSTVYKIADTGRVGNQVTQKIASFALISVEGDQIRYRLDGTDPTTTTGHLLNVNDVLNISSSDDIAKFRAIRVTTDATIQVSYA